MLEHLLRMTPLAWRASENDLQRILLQEQMDITVDLSVLIGQQK